MFGCMQLVWRSIVKVLGMLNMVLGIMMLSVPLIDMITLNPISVYFTITAAILIAVGWFSSRIEAEPLGLIESIVTASIAWPLLSFEASIPLMLSLNINWIDAFFESVSGFTGTGFTILANINALPPSIVTWRSIMQWTGELGIVVFAMLLFPYFHRYGARVYGLERPVKIEASFYRTAQRIVSVYVLLTIAGILACIYAGMNLYEAVNHTFVGIATGGIPMYDEGYERVFARAPYTYIPITALMILGGMNFVLLDKLIRGEFKAVWRSEEFRAYIALILVFTVAITASYTLVEGYNPIYALIYAPFNLVSGLTTTGFSLGSIRDLKPLTKFILIVAMFIGGMAFSTAGGIKIYRFVILVKKLKSTALSMITLGGFEKPIKIDGNILDESEVASNTIFPLIHMFAISVLAAIMTVYGYNFIDALFEATSAASCVGLSTGIVSPASPLGIKVIIILLMLLGRLEYAQIYLVLGYFTGRRVLEVLR